MPKFYRQNRKRIDPRYFLHETALREEDVQFRKEDVEADAAKLKAAGGDWRKVKSTLQDAYDADNNLTPYGKAVEAEYRRMSNTISSKITKFAKDIFGINKTNKKMDNAIRNSGAYTNKRGVYEGTERIGIDDAFENLRSDLLDMTETYLEPNQGEIVDTLLKQLDKFKCGRVQVDQSVPSLSPSNIQQLAALSDSDPSRFFEIAAMLTKTGAAGNTADSDGDGISDEKEAAFKKVLNSP